MNPTHPTTRTLVRFAPVAAALLLGVAGTACGEDATASTPDGAAGERPATTAPAPPHEGPIEVVAEDFGYVGLPERVAAGEHVVSFENRGAELHELFVFRNPDGLSLHEIAALGPTGAPEAVELVTVVMAAAGAPAPDAVTLDLEPGAYVVACFIPTPTDGRHHFEHGMTTSFTVE